MAGVAMTYFSGKKEQYQAELTAAQQTATDAAAKVQYAGQGLALLAKANPAPADLETIIDLYQKAE